MKLIQIPSKKQDFKKYTPKMYPQSVIHLKDASNDMAFKVRRSVLVSQMEKEWKKEFCKITGGVLDKESNRYDNWEEAEKEFLNNPNLRYEFSNKASIAILDECIVGWDSVMGSASEAIEIEAELKGSNLKILGEKSGWIDDLKFLDYVRIVYMTYSEIFLIKRVNGNEITLSTSTNNLKKNESDSKILRNIASDKKIKIQKVQEIPYTPEMAKLLVESDPMLAMDLLTQCLNGFVDLDGFSDPNLNPS